MTNSRHTSLTRLGATPKLRGDRSADNEFSARNVLVCLPPSSGNYEEELHQVTTKQPVIGLKTIVYLNRLWERIEHLMCPRRSGYGADLRRAT